MCVKVDGQHTLLDGGKQKLFAIGAVDLIHIICSGFHDIIKRAMESVVIGYDIKPYEIRNIILALTKWCGVLAVNIELTFFIWFYSIYIRKFLK